MDQEKLAEWLVIGFKRCMMIKEVMIAAGANDMQIDELHQLAQFMPENAWAINMPVRAYVEAEWPKLAAFLVKNEGNPEKMLSVVPQIMRLKSRGNHGSRRSKEDAAELRQTKRSCLAESASYRMSRDAQKSTQRGAWTTCK